MPLESPAGESLGRSLRFWNDFLSDDGTYSERVLLKATWNYNPLNNSNIEITALPPPPSVSVTLLSVFRDRSSSRSKVALHRPKR